MERRVGTAGWALPREVRGAFDTDGTHLERYARRFPCVEINSSFYRPHRPATYARWANSVPDDFRFALKLSKEISHVRRLTAFEEPLRRFLDETAALGTKRDIILVQLPPSFAYEAGVVERFFDGLRGEYSGRVACEPRHPSWFVPAANAVLEAHDVARVAADPPLPGMAMIPGGSQSLHYWRLHGAPRTYYSAYDEAHLTALAGLLRRPGPPAWCIFDNTAIGAATPNALELLDALG